VELYNLRTDVGGTTNLVTRLPEEAEALRRAMSQWRTATGAAVPDQLNPAFDPSLQKRGGRGRQRDALRSRDSR